MNARFLTLATLAVLSAPAAGQINPNIGTAQGATDDSVRGPLALPFSFTLPDGSVVTELFADSNGRVFGSSSEGSDFTESENDLNNDPSQICAYWDDLNPVGGAGIGDIYYNNLGTSVLISWVDVVEFGAAAGTEFSIQLEVFPDSSFVICSDSRTPTNDAIVGCSVGNGAGLPSLSDISAFAPFNSGSQGTVFETFDNTLFPYDLVNCCTTFTPNTLGGYGVTTTCPPGTPRPRPSIVTSFGPECMPNPPGQPLPVLSNVTNPIIGQTFELSIGNDPGNLSNFYILGTPMAPQPLNAIGVPCRLVTDGAFATVATAPDVNYTLVIPNLLSLVGQTLNFQGGILTPQAGNPLFLLLTNEIRFTIGQI